MVFDNYINLYVFVVSLDGNIGMDKWLSKLEASGWMSHVKDSLTCACVAAQCIDKEGDCYLTHILLYCTVKIISAP